MIRLAAAALIALAPLAGAANATVQDGHTSHAHADFQSDRIHVRVDGAQGLPDVVLIPGLASSPQIWQQTADQLKDRYRVHRIHVNGFGGAAPAGNAQPDNAHVPLAAPVAEEIARYIEQAGLQKPAVVGHSMGGTLGMMVTARHPQSVGKLMVVDMLPFVGAMFGPLGTTAETILPTANAVWSMQAGLPRDAYVAASTTAINGMINTVDRREMALQHMRDSDQAVAASAYYDLMVTDLRPELASITAPVSVLYVAFVAPNMTPQLTDGIYQASYISRPDFSLKRIDDSAHFIMLDQEELFSAEIEAFLSAN